MPLQQTSGNVTSDAYGGGTAVTPVYIEDVMSTFLYTGNGSTQTITNGIDLAGKGGMVWLKPRANPNSYNGGVWDTNRGALKVISTEGSYAESTATNSLTSFNSNGFTIGTGFGQNDSGNTQVSWTFRKQPKFFDVQTVSHTNGVDNTIDFSSLGTIGCVIIKRTDAAQNWYVWHRSLGNGYYGLFLNSTNAPSNFGTAPVSVSGTTVTMTDSSAVGGYFGTGSYVVYAYAHNAGGFGLTGTDNVISCGSFTTNGSGNVSQVSLGYEPQWVLYKTTDVADNWRLVDSMRGMPVTAPTGEPVLKPNTSAAEQADAGVVVPNATGFSINGASPSFTYIYIAIRRGPMKVPTDATKVFKPITRTGTNAAATVTGVGFPVDFGIFNIRNAAGYYNGVLDRLRGVTQQLVSSQTNAEVTRTGNIGVSSFASNDGLSLIADDYGFSNENAKTYIEWLFGRAPSFFDEVCYTGTGSATTQTHNLGVVPELIIVKGRNTAYGWPVYVASVGNDSAMQLQSTGTPVVSDYWNNTTPTSSVFSLGTAVNTNQSTKTYVAYLFATCAGVSKVGSYTGNGTTQTINCGFTGGARFVLIKRTDSTGDWYVYDTARGMTTLTDPYLLLNSTAAESATLGSVTTVSTGFAVNASVLAAINTNGATYIYLSIA